MATEWFWDLPDIGPGVGGLRGRFFGIVLHVRLGPLGLCIRHDTLRSLSGVTVLALGPEGGLRPDLALTLEHGLDSTLPLFILLHISANASISLQT